MSGNGSKHACILLANPRVSQQTNYLGPHFDMSLASDCLVHHSCSDVIALQFMVHKDEKSNEKGNQMRMLSFFMRASFEDKLQRTIGIVYVPIHGFDFKYLRQDDQSLFLHSANTASSSSFIGRRGFIPSVMAISRSMGPVDFISEERHLTLLVAWFWMLVITWQG